jgi:hypothetical protein
MSSKKPRQAARTRAIFCVLTVQIKIILIIAETPCKIVEEYAIIDNNKSFAQKNMKKYNLKEENELCQTRFRLFSAKKKSAATTPALWGKA